jgi:hypothetical protein
LKAFTYNSPFGVHTRSNFFLSFYLAYLFYTAFAGFTLDLPILTGFTGFDWIYRFLHCLYRLITGFTGFALELPVLHWIYRFCTGFTGFALDLPVDHWIYRFCTGFVG